MEGVRDFAAIDFETANGKRTSVCSVGVVIVRRWSSGGEHLPADTSLPQLLLGVYNGDSRAYAQ